MKIRIFVTLLAITGLALAQTSGTVVIGELTRDSDSKFEVKELTPQVVAEIEKSDRAVQAVMEKLANVQKELKAAQDAKWAAVAKATQGLGLFEGKCALPENRCVSCAVMYYESRKFRRAEIRGKYALISEGSELCSGYSSFVNDPNILTWKD